MLMENTQCEMPDDTLPSVVMNRCIKVEHQNFIKVNR